MTLPSALPKCQQDGLDKRPGRDYGSTKIAEVPSGIALGTGHRRQRGAATEYDLHYPEYYKQRRPAQQKTTSNIAHDTSGDFPVVELMLDGGTLMPGPCSAPNGDARLTNTGASLRVCSVHGRRLHQCAKERNSRCQHRMVPAREFLLRRNRLRTGKTGK